VEILAKVFEVFCGCLGKVMDNLFVKKME
jgi:hypothetical protein